MASIAAFSALCFVVGLVGSWSFCAAPACSSGEICTAASHPSWLHHHSCLVPEQSCRLTAGPLPVSLVWLSWQFCYIQVQLVSEETLHYSASRRAVESEPVTAPLDKVHHVCCKCSVQGTRLGTGTLIWVNEGTSAPAAPESLLV